MDTKRLRNAIILSLAVAALFGTGLGLVSAAGEDTPDQFVVGVKRVGDEVTYKVNFDGFTWEESFTWETPRAMIDGDGSSSLSNVLTIQTDGPEALNWHFSAPTEVTSEVVYPLNSFDAISGRIISADSTQNQGTLSQSGFSSVFLHKSYFPARASCSIFEVPEVIHRDSVIATQPCSIANNHAAGLRPVEMDNGLLLLEGDGAFAGTDYGPIRAWFGGGIPYPMRMETQDLGLSTGESEMTAGTMELISYKTGTTELVQNAAPKTPSYVEQLGPRMPWGPAGNFAGFSAKDGYMALKEQGIIDKEHFVFAELKYYDLESYRETNWTVGLTDGRMMTIAERIETGTLNILTGPTTSIRTSNQGELFDKPTAKDLPDEMPTIASLLAMHKSYSEFTDAPIGYGFGFTCFAGDCDDVRLRPLGGASLLTFQSGILVDTNMTLTLSHVTKNLLGYVTTWEASGKSYSAFALQATSPVEPEAENTKAGVAPWIAPSPAAAAGMGFFGLVVGALYYFKPALFGMFTRLQKDELLEHPGRAHLMSTIEDKPGLHLQALLRETEMAGGTLRHHLEILAKNDYVKRIDAGGRACYFPRGKTDHGTMVHQAALGTPSAKAIHSALQSGPMTVGDLADAIGLGRSTTSHHVSRLREQGILLTSKQGRNTLVSLGANLAS